LEGKLEQHAYFDQDSWLQWKVVVSRPLLCVFPYSPIKNVS